MLMTFNLILASTGRCFTTSTLDPPSESKWFHDSTSLVYQGTKLFAGFVQDWWYSNLH